MKAFRWPILFLVLVTFVAQPVSAEGCVWRCVYNIDTTSCLDTKRERLGNAESCTIQTLCTLVIRDPDGPGGNDPVVLIQCRYDCDMKWCIWV